LEKQNPNLYYGPLSEQESEVMKYAVKVVIDKETGKVKKLEINKPK
jgi:hypothetical protein